MSMRQKDELERCLEAVYPNLLCVTLPMYMYAWDIPHLPETICRTVLSRQTGRDVHPSRKEICVKQLTLCKVMYRQGSQMLGILYGCPVFGCPTKPQAHSSVETAEPLIKSLTFPLITSTQTTPSPFLNERYQMSFWHPIHPSFKHSYTPKLQAAQYFTPMMIKLQIKISHLVPVSSKWTI